MNPWEFLNSQHKAEIFQHINWSLGSFWSWWYSVLLSYSNLGWLPYKFQATKHGTFNVYYFNASVLFSILLSAMLLELFPDKPVECLPGNINLSGLMGKFQRKYLSIQRRDNICQLSQDFANTENPYEKWQSSKSTDFMVVVKDTKLLEEGLHKSLSI